jgi:hypothetical protein
MEGNVQKNKYSKNYIHMKKLLLSAVAMAILLSTGQNASAHISYTGRNFGTLSVGGAAVVIGNQTISSSFGWADATDTDWGDSHRGRFFRFTLNSTASVIITVSRNHAGNQKAGNGTANSFLPAVSVYSGLAQGTVTANQTTLNGTVTRTEALAHDSSALSVSSRGNGTEGSFRALANWSIANDPTYVTDKNADSGILIPARLASFTYIGHAADGTAANFGNAPGIEGDKTADGFLTATFLDLAPGDYSIFVGGADYASQTVQVGSPYPTYGVFVSAQAIAATPAPAPAPSVSSSTTDTKSIKSLAEALGLNTNGKSNKRLGNEIERELKKASASSGKKTKAAQVKSNSKKTKSRQ